MNLIMIYFLIGTIWGLLWEIQKLEITNGTRVRLVLFWPITMAAWIIGFIEAAKNMYDNDEEM